MGLWLLGALAAAGLATAALASRDDLPELPPDAVAQVGDSVITKSEFDSAAEQAPRKAGLETAARDQPYDPPEYSACVAAKKDSPVPAGMEESSDERLKEECEDEFDQLMPGVMQSLIEAEWIRQEAKAQRVELRKNLVTGALDVQQVLQQDARAAKEDRRAAAHRLTPGMRVSLLEQELANEIAKRVSQVSEQEIERYYERNGRRLEERERRDLRLVLTETQRAGAEASAALQRGEGWSEVAKEYSTDEATKGRGGKLTGVSRGELEDELDQAAFTARAGEMEGPVKTLFGWYVFEVTKITGKRQQSLEQAKQRIERILRDQKKRRAIDALNERISDSYGPKTVCADEFKVALCANG